MLYILPRLSENGVLLRSVKHHANAAQYPVTDDVTLTTFFIGTTTDFFPNTVPTEKQIILKSPSSPSNTFPPEAHVFSWITLTNPIGHQSLAAFLHHELEKMQLVS